MKQLIFNFIKRALLLPALVAGLALAAVLYLGQAQVTESQSKLSPAAPGTFSLAGYNETEYTKFSELADGDLVATMSGEDFGLSERAVCYDAATEDISVETPSSEPWNSGALLVTGTDAQLRAMYNAAVGDTLTLNFPEHGEYRYTVKQIVVGVHREELTGYMAPGTLCLASPYNDLSAAAQPNIYILFIAAQA